MFSAETSLGFGAGEVTGLKLSVVEMQR